MAFLSTWYWSVLLPPVVFRDNEVDVQLLWPSDIQSDQMDRLDMYFYY